MYFLIIIFELLFCTFAVSHGENSTEGSVNEMSANDIADTLVAVLTSNDDVESSRIKELKEKLHKVDSYVVDRGNYARQLIDEVKQTDLNQTNFFSALKEQDPLSLFMNNSETKSLYLRLKEKMNRDDVLKVLAERGDGKMMQSARRMQSDALSGRYQQDKFVNDIVDKLLAEYPSDDHKYTEKDSYNQYWDPQAELEELSAYHKHDGRRIFKGERTTVRFYPFMVSVHVMGRFWCGGALYWHDLVLTSASCLQLMHNNRFFRENPRVLQVRVGSNHSRIGGELVDALEVYFHPAYNPRTLRNNIAVIRLRLHLTFSYHRVPKIIPISDNAGGMPATGEVTLLGWGVTKTSQKMAYEPIFLQRKVLPVYPNMFCKEVYGEKFITETMFCAGTMTTGEGACDHDAGGPAIMGGRLIGIISFGPAVCGFANTPTVFTLVGAYSDWIETVNETMPGYYRGKSRTTTKSPLTLPSSRNAKQYTRRTEQRPVSAGEPDTDLPARTPEPVATPAQPVAPPSRRAQERPRKSP